MPQIALVANIAWNLYNFRRPLILALQQAGFEVLLVATPDDYVGRLEALGCRFVPLKRLSRKGTNPVGDWLLYRELRHIYRQFRPDLVLHYTIKPNIYGSLAARSAGLKSVATVTGLGYTFLSDGFAAKVARWLYKWALPKSARVIFQNEDDRQLFLRRQLVGEEHTQVIYGSGIDTQAFAPQPARADKDKFIFLFVGRLLFDKGVRELMEAMRLLRKAGIDAECQLVGAIDAGNPSALTQEQVQEFVAEGLAVYQGTTDTVADFIAAADVVVLPSYREGLPRVMLEALAMARPVITTNTAGCRETVVQGKNGLLVPSHNAEALAEAMRELYECSEEERARMGAAGRELALQRFAQNGIIAQYLQLIAELLPR